MGSVPANQTFFLLQAVDIKWPGLSIYKLIRTTDGYFPSFLVNTEPITFMRPSQSPSDTGRHKLHRLACTCRDRKGFYDKSANMADGMNRADCVNLSQVPYDTLIYFLKGEYYCIS